ncbi:hypothetical protein [Nostoc sp. 'Peltigera malacea cyanobiont' DB3992]|uniref:hypothetical protein n=1 Tax=Nostoc sp. 'Peltigera malacea cyanobiont' DB3992 TaxID=1206980 RepID=UPI000C05560F|nr:hypothetical protein [Nostoc sp. 'Peltigera malacea cyanobiont' DB3992]PHM06278.1 hypothetical protein CK516_34670 [Nostoc sp. 'Peltigera malacea cyanobiont' DB3992]
MKTALTTPVNSNQTTQTSQLIPASPTSVENPSTWMRNGDSPGEIILAVAILTSVSIAGIASVIVAITGLVKTLVPVMVQPTRENNK